MQMLESHQEILKRLRLSTELNRSNLSDTADKCLSGYYSVRKQASSRWQHCQSPPVSGAAEWIYISQSGMPLFYWCREKNMVMLIG